MKRFWFVPIIVIFDQLIKVSVRATLADWTYWQFGPVYVGRLDHYGSWLSFFIVVSSLLLGYILVSTLCAFGDQHVAAKWFRRCAGLLAVQWITQSIDLGLLGYATNYLGVFCIAHLGDGCAILSGIIAFLTALSLIWKGIVHLFTKLPFVSHKVQPNHFTGQV